MGSDITLSVPTSDLEVIGQRGHVRPQVALVLGSGLSAVADAVEDAAVVDYGDLAGFPQFGHVVGHAGRLVIGTIGATPVVVFQGRVHSYQGASAYDAAYPSRLAAALGCDTVVVTNAAGGVSPELSPGDLMLITDQINLRGDSPLTGWSGPEGGTPFIPMGGAFDADLISLADEVAAERGLSLRRGVYAGLLGPAFETPAEVAMLATLGADAVGMSTVPEVIAARALGLRVLGVSLVTNAAGGSDLSHEEVLEVGARAADSLVAVLLGILRRLKS